MSKTKDLLTNLITLKRSELEEINKEVADLEKKNDEAKSEEELNAVSDEVKALQEKIDALKKELAEAEAALAELEAPAEEPTPETETDPVMEAAECDGKDDEIIKPRSLRQITEKRGVKTNMNNEELVKRAEAFATSGRMTINTDAQRSTLMSGGNIAAPTGADGINDHFNAVSSIVDMVKVVDCKGMGSNKVAYMVSDGTAAAATEGNAITASDPTFGFVTITPASKGILSYLSNQVRKQSPLNYEAKVNESALNALRAAASKMIVDNIYASSITAPLTAEVSGSNGTITEKTLRKIALAYGGNENVAGDAVLFLNKNDLIAFGDVRGTNDKKAVYDITPDTTNPNTGIIKDGGLAVKYCINSNCNVLNGTAKTSTAKKTMIYGQPLNAELDLFGDYEVAVSDDFKFDANMLTVRGTADLGTDVVVKDGFVVVTLAAI